MTTQSGISVSFQLKSAFAQVQADESTRALFVTIRNESLEAADQLAISFSQSIPDEFGRLSDLVEPLVPSYILFRLQDLSQWMLVVYVPNEAKVREKMLYASTRATLTKQLGESNFVDSLFATSKEDLTTSAYKAHLLHNASAAPLTQSEIEAKQVKSAEEKEIRGSMYKVSHLGPSSSSSAGAVGSSLSWSQEAEESVRALGENSKGLISLNIDLAKEKVKLLSTSDALTIPKEASFNFYCHELSSQIVFIYCCPSNAPIKARMVYASASRSISNHATTSLGLVIVKRLETSDPSEITEQLIEQELGVATSTNAGSTPAVADDKPINTGFSKPKRPGRR